MAQSHTTSTSPTVTVHALSCGHFTLPEHQFVKPSSLEARKTVPSLAFLIQHKDHHSGNTTRILFDLGLRRDVERYPPPIQKHTEKRQPMTTRPDVVEHLAKGGLTPDDIDYVIYSHVHWDHIGEPRDFPSSTFVVGHGSRALLDGPSTTHLGSHSFFEADLLPERRSIELSDPSSEATTGTSHPQREGPNFSAPWQPHPSLSHPQTLDLFQDGSVYIVNAPGHLPGHINLLLRTSSDPERWMYLGGDACHDRRLLTGEKEIGEWTDDGGRVCCIHIDREKAEETIRRIRVLDKEGVEIVFAHDVDWEDEPGNKERFFGAERVV